MFVKGKSAAHLIVFDIFDFVVFLLLFVIDSYKKNSTPPFSLSFRLYFLHNPILIDLSFVTVVPESTTLYYTKNGSMFVSRRESRTRKESAH